ncbi:hypothetical protein BDQ17DRAFT_1431600 [Cyathus striatus]|nr:hypothetical protein BDQ17DRAFT_1431600 [Cyathus striatus]
MTSPAGGVRKAARIVHGRSGSVYAFCCMQPSQCGYFIDISKIYYTATLQSEYFNLPTGTNGIPDMSKILTDFLLKDSNGISPEHLEGFCGEHISSTSNNEQQSSEARLSNAFISLGKRKRCEYDRIMHMHLPPKIQQPSLGAARVVKRTRKGKETLSSTSHLVSDREWDLLMHLNEGKGVSPVDAAKFLEICTSCGQYLLSDYLLIHILGCSDD